MEKHVVDFSELNGLVNDLRKRILTHFFGSHFFTPGAPLMKEHCRTLVCYPVPRGGVPVAMGLAGTMNIVLTDDPEAADFIVDDLIDSGRTMAKFRQPMHSPECKLDKPFFALLDKRSWNKGDAWVVWPWEATAESGIEDHIARLIEFIGDDPNRGGLEETPDRVAKAWQYWGGGYGQDPKDILKVFEDGAEGVDEMVLVKDIPFYTHCEHHMAPFFGTATIAYLPNKKIVGLSKLSRVLDIFARRLQVQERLTCQVADAIMENLQPLGCGVVIKARHLCMESRGVKQQGHHTVTSALRGIFKTERDVRAEFLALAR